MKQDYCLPPSENSDIWITQAENIVKVSPQANGPISSSTGYGSMHYHGEDASLSGERDREDTYSSLLSSPQPAQCHAEVARLQSLYADPSNHIKELQLHRALVDTAAPFESVKEAVTKFGGITDWKAHKLQAIEKHRSAELELEKTLEEIPYYKRQSEAAESAKNQVLEELDSMKMVIEELKLKLEKAQMEDNEAKQDLELAQLRVEEREQGIADEASVAAKAELEIAQSRHEAALVELKYVKEELETLKGQYDSLVSGRNSAQRNAEVVVSVSKEVEKTVEELTLDLIMAKQSLETAHAAHMEVDEQRAAATMSKEQEEANWKTGMKEVEEEIQQLIARRELGKETLSRLESATTTLDSLKSKTAAYMGSEIVQEVGGKELGHNLNGQLEEAKDGSKMRSAISSARQELQEIRSSITVTKEKIKDLSSAAKSLTSDLEKEKAALESKKHKDGMASIALASLESDLERVEFEIESAQINKKEVEEKMEGLPRALKQAAQEAEQAKSRAKEAEEEHIKAKEEAQDAIAKLSTGESLLHATIKETEANRASERLAMAAIKALQQSGLGEGECSSSSIALSLEAYFELSKSAHNAEKHANMLVATAISQIEAARDSKWKSLKKLEEASNEVAHRKEALKMAVEKAERSNEGKLRMEQELRKWREEHEERRKATDTTATAFNRIKDPCSQQMEKVKHLPEREEEESIDDERKEQEIIVLQSPDRETEAAELKGKKKKSFFPRIVMFLARRKVQTK